MGLMGWFRPEFEARFDKACFVPLRQNPSSSEPPSSRMAENKEQDEPTLNAKRKPEDDLVDYPSKSHKLQLSGNNSPPPKSQVELDPQVEDEEEDDDEEEEESCDRKGKGIMRDDKGKGIMIEEEDDEDEEGSSDSDSSSSSEGGSDLEQEDSDLSDDPLAEVDLDNILPSRTRRRQVQPGVYIRPDTNGNHNNDSDDSDD